MPDFLDVDDVMLLHADQIAKYGGSPELRDLGLLESALAQPRATFGGAFLHEDVYAMAAAYLFHIVKNHPFVDGNKRTGLVAALTFLDLNGIEVQVVEGELHDLTIQVACGSSNKDEIAAFFRSHA